MHPYSHKQRCIIALQLNFIAQHVSDFHFQTPCVKRAGFHGARNVSTIGRLDVMCVESVFDQDGIFFLWRKREGMKLASTNNFTDNGILATFCALDIDRSKEQIQMQAAIVAVDRDSNGLGLAGP